MLPLCRQKATVSTGWRNDETGTLEWWALCDDHAPKDMVRPPGSD